MDEREAMTRALDLAWRGWGRVQPNPLVGAVVLAGGDLAGEGWHAEFGDRHAEPVALERAGERARGATLCVTLEPCAHQGKQPPCVDAIVRSGVRRVVAAVADPNSVAAGGAAALRAAGIEVEIGLLHDRAAAQNAGFLHQLRTPSRPWVALKLATTLDGRIADPSGNSRWISGPEAREFVQWLRAGFDAIGVGGRTARADNPSLTVRGPLQPRVPPRRVVFDATADLDSSLALVRTARETPTFLVTSPTAPSDQVQRLVAAGVEVIRAASLDAGLGTLRERGIGTLLVEGGGRLAAGFLADGLVDRYYWVQSPLWLGDTGVPAVRGLAGRALERAERWRVVDRRTLEEDTLLVVDRV